MKGPGLAPVQMSDTALFIRAIHCGARMAPLTSTACRGQASGEETSQKEIRRARETQERNAQVEEAPEMRKPGGPRISIILSGGSQPRKLFIGLDPEHN